MWKRRNKLKTLDLSVKVFTISSGASVQVCAWAYLSKVSLCCDLHRCTSGTLRVTTQNLLFFQLIFKNGLSKTHIFKVNVCEFEFVVCCFSVLSFKGWMRVDSLFERDFIGVPSKNWQADGNNAAAAAETSHFLCLLFTPIIRSSQRLLLHRGNPHKTEHLKVIKNKVLDPSPMHDIQSVGHTWLLPDKTLSSSNSRSCIVVSVGDKETLPMPFRSFQCSLILGELLTRGVALCVCARTLTAGILLQVPKLNLMSQSRAL